MTGPVDVLAWLDSLHAVEASGAITNRKWTEAQEVRAAVAELVEAANYAYPPGDYSQDAHGYAVRAALARVGGAA